MGNSKSSHQLSNSFDKDTQFSCENDDGGFLEAKLKAAEMGSGGLSRGQTGRKSFHYIRLRDNLTETCANHQTSAAPVLSDKFKRVYSLPASRIKKKGNTLSKKEPSGSKSSTHKIPVQGFDMFRHHLGQMNCDVVLFQQLESEIHSLNDKLADIEQTRQSCLDKLNELHKEVRHSQLILADSEQKISTKKNKANDLALKIIHNYIERIDGLLKTESEPFLLDVPIGGDDKKGCSSSSSSEFSGSSHLEQSNHATHHKPDTPRGKRQQIKDAYNHLIRSIMPKLFGKQFAHKDESNYCILRRNLTELREQVNGIGTSDEQKLVDAKRIFLQEVDGYLRTLDEMVSCGMNGCVRCKT